MRKCWTLNSTRVSVSGDECVEEGMVLGAARPLARTVHVAGGGGGLALGEVTVSGHPHLPEVSSSATASLTLGIWSNRLFCSRSTCSVGIIC